MVIAVDGPSGVGKSTVSRGVAARLGVPHLDTGAGYRAATLAALRAAVDLGDTAAVTAAVTASTIEYEMGAVWLDGEGVSTAIRRPEVTDAVSTVAAIAGVRRHLVSQQRLWVMAHGGAAVVEGRDIGTVVFPDAPVKVFLDARQEVRAARRAADPEAGGRGVAAIAADLQRRDRIDTGRDASPLRPADDAHIIDTSDLDAEQVIERIMGLAQPEGE